MTTGADLTIPALTVWQPWASCLAAFATIHTAKDRENRSWQGCCRPWGATGQWHWVVAGAIRAADAVPVPGPPEAVERHNPGGPPTFSPVQRCPRTSWKGFEMTAAITPLPGLPDMFGQQGHDAQILYGVPVWWVYHGDECTYDELYAHTHDRRRALAAASRMVREAECYGEVPRNKVEFGKTGWCLLVTGCGCTPEQHADHSAAIWSDPDADTCPGCQRPDLPPCNPDAVLSWLVEEVPAGTSNALPFTRVGLS